MKQQPGEARGVLVVDRRPLERNLVRFILQENGFTVTAEAATPAEALRAIEAHAPAVVVLHENAAWEQGQPTIPLVRDALPDARVLVIAPAFGVVRVELLRDADAVLEEGVGFKDLPFVVGKLSAGEPAKADEPAPPVAVAPPRRTRERWVNRLQGAVAAGVVFLALVVARAAAPPAPEPAARIALVQAQQSLEDLRAASSAPADVLIQQAIELAEDRADAIQAGADVSVLDAQIRSLVTAVLPTLSEDVARTLVWVFSDVPGLTTPSPTPTEEPPPSPSEEPLPSPTEEPPPTTEPPVVAPSPVATEAPPPSPSPTVTETEPPSPSPTVTETEPPSPEPTETETETPSPSPTETETEPPLPSPTEQPSPTETPSPAQTEPASPSATDAPSPSPTDTPSPSPTDTPSPSPTDTPSPSPTDTPSPTGTKSPSPSETTSPTVTSSPTGTDGPPAPTGNGAGSTSVAVFLLPPALGATAAIARRRARRTER